MTGADVSESTPRLDAVSRITRSDNWWYSKIPPLLLVAYVALLSATPGLSIALAAIVGVLFSLCCVAVFGHVINDIFDVDEDRRVGKPNAMAERSTWQRVTLCVVPAAAGPLSRGGLG